MIKMKLHFILILSIIALLSACTPALKKKTDSIPGSAPKSLEVKPIILVEPEPVTKPPDQKNVLILLSSPAKPYQQIADNLAKVLGDYAVQITLSGQLAQNRAVIRDIEASDTKQIVAIGLKALNSVRGIQDKQIIFAQIINYQHLTADNVKGVSALPAPEKLFKDWKILSPGLSKVAVIVGKNLNRYLDRAKKAARAQNIELIVEEVNSDKDFMYRSKNLKSDVDGQWILPDNRVLSGKALKEVMAYGSRRGRQIVVFTPKLLSFGGFFYVTPDLDMVSKGILKRLSDSAGEATIKGENILPIMSHTMGINQNISRQFNLKIPQEYREYINGE